MRDTNVSGKKLWVPASHDSPGLGDDVPCTACGEIALDTGLECSECGHDNYEAVTGKPFEPAQAAGGDA